MIIVQVLNNCTHRTLYDLYAVNNSVLNGAEHLRKVQAMCGTTAPPRGGPASRSKKWINSWQWRRNRNTAVTGCFCWVWMILDEMFRCQVCFFVWNYYMAKYLTVSRCIEVAIYLFHHVPVYGWCEVCSTWIDMVVLKCLGTDRNLYNRSRNWNLIPSCKPLYNLRVKF